MNPKVQNMFPFFFTTACVHQEYLLLPSRERLPSTHLRTITGQMLFPSSSFYVLAAFYALTTSSHLTIQGLGSHSSRMVMLNSTYNGFAFQHECNSSLAFSGGWKHSLTSTSRYWGFLLPMSQDLYWDLFFISTTTLPLTIIRRSWIKRILSTGSDGIRTRRIIMLFL